MLHPNQAELIAADEDGTIRVWDLTANACSYELVPDGKTPIRSLSIANDASLIVAASNKGACFAWRLLAADKTTLSSSSNSNSTTFEPLHRLQAHNTYILKALLSPDVKFVFDSPHRSRSTLS